MNCKICNEEVKLSSFTNNHLRKSHNITAKEYYDKFIKKDGEGICSNDWCHNETSFKRINEGYAEYCSKACTSRSLKSKEKSKQTMLKKFGVEHALQSKDIRNKMEEKNLLEKGVKNVFQLKDVKEKIKETNLENHGVEFPMQNREILEKSNNTNLLKYGYKRPVQNKEIQKKIQKTNLNKYNVKSTLQDKNIIEKITLTRKKIYWDKFLLLLKIKKIKYELDIEYFLNNSTGFKYKCLRCNRKFIKDCSNADRIFCTCMKYRSKYEDEIIKELQTFYTGEIVKNRLFIDSNNKRFEIDVFIPEFNLGIDFGGMFWHSNVNKDKNYHQDKYLYFKKLNIKLIQVFENEWKIKRDVVLSIIKTYMGENEKIYARKCEIKEVSDNDYKLFLVENHLQSYAIASVRLGLYYNSKLVSIVSFRISRYSGINKYSNKYEYELTRSCTRLGYTVIGGFSKLLNHFISKYNPKNIVSYIDVRYFNGNSYEKSGFKLKGLNKPNYQYFHKNNQLVLYNRMGFQKSKLKAKLENYDPNLSEYENMLINGYYRIYNAGILVYVKEQI